VQKWQGVTKESPTSLTKRTATRDMQKNKYSNSEVAKQKPTHQKIEIYKSLPRYRTNNTTPARQLKEPKQQTPKAKPKRQCRSSSI